MKFRRKTITEIADMICGDDRYFRYRSSTYLSEFFADCELNEYIHDGSTRKWWVADTLEDILLKSSSGNGFVPTEFVTVIRVLMDKSDATKDDKDRGNALKKLNISLAREGLQASYDAVGVCQLKNTETNAVLSTVGSPQRAWSADEIEKRGKLIKYLDRASEDEIIEELLLPLFRQLGFQRITSIGHKERILEYGKDIWMKYCLPTRHKLYFGIQVKRGKIGAAGKSQNPNVAEVYNQIQMMLGHVIFDPETNKESLVDHAIIIAGGEITKQAKNWLGGRLDASQRSQILFMDRNDILDLMLIYSVPLPSSINAIKSIDGIPF